MCGLLLLYTAIVAPVQICMWAYDDPCNRSCAPDRSLELVLPPGSIPAAGPAPGIDPCSRAIGGAGIDSCERCPPPGSIPAWDGGTGGAALSRCDRSQRVRVDGLLRGFTRPGRGRRRAGRRRCTQAKNALAPASSGSCRAALFSRIRGEGAQRQCSPNPQSPTPSPRPSPSAPELIRWNRTGARGIRTRVRSGGSAFRAQRAPGSEAARCAALLPRDCRVAAA